MIIGGVAVIALGVPRLTVDIDATVASVDPELLSKALERRGIRPRIPDAVDFARARQVFLGIHEASDTPVDVILARLPFEEEAIRSSREQNFAEVRIRVPRPEDLVIYKIVAGRPQDLDDVEGLLLLHGLSIDLGRVRRVVREFADALGDEERVHALERLIRKAGPEGSSPP